MIALIDEPERDNSGIFIDVFLTVLGVALNFIPVVGPAAGLGLASLALINGAIAGVKQVPAIAQRIWPRGTEESVAIQTDGLRIEFQDRLREALRQNFENTLGIIQGLQQPDTSAFRAFAEHGLFVISGDDSPIVDVFRTTTRNLLKQSATTFLVSEALAQNGWQALILPGVDGEGIYNADKSCPRWAEEDGCKQKEDIGCSSHDGFGQCNEYYWWYSQE